MSGEPTAFERLGGEEPLRAIIDAFVERVFQDPMIGYMFRNVSAARLKRLEYEHAAAHLGGPVSYSGRGLREAHAPHRIMGGQFLRRREILRQVLDRFGVLEDVQQEWLAHVDSLRPLITNDQGSECSGRA